MVHILHWLPMKLNVTTHNRIVPIFRRNLRRFDITFFFKSKIMNNFWALK